MTSSELLSEFVSRMHKPPLTAMREDGAITDLSNPIAVLMLVVDFDTELAMSGIIDFIGNETGRYARETVAALASLGCSRLARQLADVLDIAEQAGMTHGVIQSERREHLTLYEVTSFAQDHGTKWEAACEKIDQLAGAFSLQEMYDRLEQYVEQHRQALERAVQRSV
jgi:hypothetical protein